MKKFSKIALLLLLLVATVFTVIACKDESGEGSIAVKKDGMPQLVFVRGEELDLSNGVLEVTTKEGTTEVALNAEGVSVSGFDKNVLGEQTLTITYEGKTTQLTVTVVERMQMIEHVTDYLAGDALDTGKGRLKITRNDGTNYTVILNSTEVEITGYNAETIGSQTLTAKYKNGETTYECTFAVNVHAVESVELTAPKKVAYDSHDAGIDLSEGYLTLSGNGGALQREVALTEEMISGFNLGAVTEENSPYTQQVTVNYKNQQFNYDVKLIYTDISKFKKEAAAFAGLDWTGDTLPEELYDAELQLGELALELMEIYLDLSKAEKVYIDEETESLPVARAALLYGMDVMDAEVTALEGGFTIYYGEVIFTCESYADVEGAIAILENEDSQIYRVSPLLNDLIAEFSEKTVIEGVLFGDFSLLEPEAYEQLLAVFEHMLDVYDTMEQIPDDWKTQGVTNYATRIEALYATILGGGYVDTSMIEIYSLISAWRTNDDMFDLLYHYYYALEDDATLVALTSIGLPQELDQIASHIFAMMEESDMIANGYEYDTTLLFYHYYKANELAELLKASGDATIVDLYNTLPVNALLGIDDSTLFYFDTLLLYIRSMDGGFYQYIGALLGVEEYHALLDHYMYIFIQSVEDEAYEGSDAYNADVKTLFDMYVALTPTAQLKFLGTMNAYYSMGYPPLQFDDSEEYADYTCLFVTILNAYYREQFTEEAQMLYNDLVLAMEIFAQRNSVEDWETEFTTRMDNIAASYAALTDGSADQVAFDTYLKAVYEKYVSIYTQYEQSKVEETKPELGDWEDDFMALGEAIANVEIAYHLLSSDAALYNVFFSAYERAVTLSNYILDNAPDEIINAYYYLDLYDFDTYYPTDSAETEDYIATAYEFMMNNYRTMYINYVLTTVGYDAYMSSALPAFMDLYYDVVWTYIMSDEDPTTLDFDKAKVLAAMKAFSEMNADDQIWVIMLEGDYGYYYVALNAFLTEAFTEKAAAVAGKLIELEQYCILYEYYQANGVAEAELAAILETLDTILNENTDESKGLKPLYKALAGEDETSFAELEEMYAYYVALCEQLLADAEETPAA